jgi:hypothetical protein
MRAAGLEPRSFGPATTPTSVHREQQSFLEVSLALVGELRPAMPDRGDSVYDARATTEHFETSDLLSESH